MDGGGGIVPDTMRGRHDTRERTTSLEHDSPPLAMAAGNLPWPCRSRTPNIPLPFAHDGTGGEKLKPQDPTLHHLRADPPPPPLMVTDPLQDTPVPGGGPTAAGRSSRTVTPFPAHPLPTPRVAAIQNVLLLHYVCPKSPGAS